MSGYVVNFSFERIPTLRRFCLSNKRQRYVKGPFGSGKSSVCIQEIIRRGLEQKPGRDGMRRTRWAIVRNTFPELRDTTIKTVRDWYPSDKFGVFKEATHDFFITAFKNTIIELNFRALDREEDVGKLLSAEYTGAWVNEFREIPKPIVDALDGRIDRYPSMRDGGATWAGIIGDTNPPEEESEWGQFLESPPDNCEVFHQPSGLSPQAENLMTHEEYEQYVLDLATKGRSDITPGLKPDYYTNLAQGKKEDFIKVYIKGEYGYVKEGKPVYEMAYNDQLHYSRYPLIPVQGRVLILAFDFGLTPAAVTGQITPRGFCNVLREFTSEGMGIKNFTKNVVIPALNQEFKGYEVIVTGDPAGEQRAQTDEKTCFEIMRELGFKKIIVGKSNDLVARIGSVESFLSRLTDGQPTFRLDPSCKVLRKGFNGGYHYKRIKTGSGDRYADLPNKNLYSHPHDALQYFCLYLSEDIKSAGRRRGGVVSRHSRYVAATKAGY